MKLFDSVGKEHEEFKLKLNKEKDVELEAIDAQRQIAEAQAEMIAESLKTAKIDIVGGDNKFFDSIVNSITAGKQVDRLVEGSKVLSDVKETFFTGDPQQFKDEMATLHRHVWRDLGGHEESVRGCFDRSDDGTDV